MSAERVFLKGNEAIALGALHAGVNAYFAYPITPSSEVPETFAREHGRTDEQGNRSGPNSRSSCSRPRRSKLST